LKILKNIELRMQLNKKSKTVLFFISTYDE